MINISFLFALTSRSIAYWKLGGDNLIFEIANRYFGSRLSFSAIARDKLLKRVNPTIQINCLSAKHHIIILTTRVPHNTSVENKKNNKLYFIRLLNAYKTKMALW